MSRQTILLSALGAALVLVAFWFLLYQPKNDELAAIQDETATIEAQQEEARRRIAELREVRDDTPELQALLAAAESVIPRSTALPSVLRQLQQAADDSNLTLVSVAPGRPVAAAEGEEVPEGTAPDLARFSVSVEVEGAYFQIVDFLRRVEDPEISPRAVLWNTIGLSEAEDGSYPVLAATLGGELFARVPVGGDAPAEPEPEPSPTDGVSPSPSPSPSPVEGGDQG